ncbi:hypothetical protein H0I29_11820 [Polaribacter sp. R2A056_3_33]|uniref:hypothetical protein n=1 Tax=Polaribacter sp. R2A056_3_33 TaxID=2745563 RepID=UPI001C500492|nr:hypothetical protein [Polaribacter sp. R2A056_3_33]QXP69314.1 hypothetical protein H0I29_11820 [Polaribacter sp. R2A056_3_33]
MLENFKTYLINKGYSEFTPSGNPSTAYDYSKRVNKICLREAISVEYLAENIEFYIEKYGPTGNDSDFGKRSNNAFINALRRFGEFRVSHN